VGEMHHNPAKNVLFIDQPLEAIAARVDRQPAEVGEILARAQSKMLEARARRPTPFVDTTIYASWNGLMISALLEAYKVLGLEGTRDRALMALDLLLEKAYDPAKGMAHSLVRVEAGVESSSPSPLFDFRISSFGFLDDQIFVAAALLDAYEVTGARRYFDGALELTETTLRRFWDDREGGFFDTAKDSETRQGRLEVAHKPLQDSPTPSGNSMAVLVLDRLAALADRPDLREKAEAILNLFAAKAAEYGLFAATYGLALSRHLRAPLEIVVIGAAEDERTRRLLETAYRAPGAGKRVLTFDPRDMRSEDLPRGLAATLPNFPLDGVPVALVCSGNACQPAVQTPDGLTAALNEASRS
jgi:uncharacterized protein YyaL (SSP411 family)